jgi:peptidyl-prolyl cis-trans isomerase A (cyclophilin A)
MMLRRAFVAGVLLLALPAVAQTPAVAPAATPPATPLPRVDIVTDAGTMTVEVDTRAAPVTGANFLRYVDKKMLDGVSFYRVVKAGPNYGFVQFGGLGDPKRTLPPIAHEPTTQTGLSHRDGVLSVARFEPGSARGEFTIMAGDQLSLDANPVAPGDNLGYAAFARIVGGRDVLTRILDTPVDPAKTVGGAFAGEVPVSAVRIVSARRAAAAPAP